jgi:hypothetical protein
MSDTTRRTFLKGASASIAVLAGASYGSAQTVQRANTRQLVQSSLGAQASEALAEDSIARKAEIAAQADQAEMAMVRIVHASPDAPNVDIYVDGKKVLGDVPFGTVSKYLSVPPGNHKVKVTAAGDPSTVAFMGNVSVKAKPYTVAAIGELSEKTFKPLVLTDATGDTASDTARLRAVHASPDAPPVTVTVKGTDLTLFKNLPYGEASDYVDVPAGDYTLEIRNAKTADPENDCLGDVVTEVKASVKGGTAYSAFALGYVTPDDEPANTPFEIKVAADSMMK